AIWLLLSDEVLAAWVTRPLMVVSSELIWLKALSAVEIIWLATWLLAIACLVATILLPKLVAAIMPAGSSAAELIRKPVLNRVKVVCKELLELFKFCSAIKALTFVIIRVMSVLLQKVCLQRVRDVTRSERFLVTASRQAGALSTNCLCLKVALDSAPLASLPIFGLQRTLKQVPTAFTQAGSS